jgi:hypothetical protein
MTQTWKIVLMMLRIIAGSVMVLVGILGLAMPILPGWLFIIPGVLLLAKDVPFVRRFICWVLDCRPVHRLENRFPRLREPLQHLRDKLKPRPKHRRGRKDRCASARPSREQPDVA